MTKPPMKIGYWHSGKKWKKKRRCNGKDCYFYFDYPNTPTGKRAAWADWLDTLAKLEAEESQKMSVSQAAGLFNIIQQVEHLRSHGINTSTAQLQEMVSAIGVDIDVASVAEGAEATANAMMDNVFKTPAEKVDGSVGKLIASFVQSYENKANAGECSKGYFDITRVYLDAFCQWIGPNTPAKSINASTLIAYYDWLISKIGDKSFSRDYAKNMLGTLKRFVRHLWEIEVIELPRNLNSPALTIKLVSKDVVTMPLDHVAKLVKGATGQTKLYLLLQLNCGMTQRDIADLKQSEVDWKKRTITRKRSKTKKFENAPIVTYNLWAETFALLKSCRSKDKQLVLLNENGLPLLREEIKEGKNCKVDNIRTAYGHLLKKLKIKQKYQQKCLKKTSATLLTGNKDYQNYAGFFLSHAAKTLAEKHYAKKSPEIFADALRWLRTQYDF